MKVPPAVVGGRQKRHVGGLGVVRAGQIGRASEKLRHGLGDDLKRHFRSLAGGDFGPFLVQPALSALNGLQKAARQVAAHDAIELAAGLGVEFAIALVPFAPAGA